MAKINSTSIAITVSELVKDDSPATELLNDEIIAQLEAVISQLANENSQSGVLVEVIKAE
jgi:hypothetical protein